MTSIEKVYKPKNVEAKWYQNWLNFGCFSAQVNLKKEPFSIVIPPPNVTGILHMGHILNNTLQDILIRSAYQQGKAVLWLPGTDHAGIATQTRIEKELRKQNLTRHDLGRSKFIERAAQWRDQHGGIILEQLKRLGVACDWSRNVHTLDPAYSRSVLTAFVKLYERGYVYRGKRMVNWCPASLTALSDEEIDMRPQSSFLYKVRYEIVEQPGDYLEIATTRPETIMGDTGIAVHPEDERYKHLIGKHCWRPFPRAQIPIIGDTYVDRSFGTGVLKVTPAHDKADFEIGQRHKLPIIDVLNPDGTLNSNAGEAFLGLDRFEARKKITDTLKEMGLLIGTEPYNNNVGFSERAGVQIEPRLSEQWFLKYPKVSEAKRAVTEGLIQFHPERWGKTYIHWLENIQDWCISRQLWWGHRIPVWYKKGTDRSDPDNWHISVDGPTDPENWEQEEDVLDTWASSWLWPFATLGWPEPETRQKEELDFWNPTSVLVTAPDIIFFWVARMIMASLEFKGEEKQTLDSDEIAQRVPFKHVYFNGLIRDEKGRKMSKSLGNSPDPLELIDKFGADGVRFGLLGIAPRGQDVLFSEERVQQGRNFCNKLWNACRLRQMSGDIYNNTTQALIIQRLDPSVWDAEDHAILTRLATTLDQVNDTIEHFEFNATHQAIYTFFWNDFCDWYLEISKLKLKDPSLKANCLAIQDLCMRQVLLILHPFVPFITEELWHDLGYTTQDPSDPTYFIQNVSAGDGNKLKQALTANNIQLDPESVQTVERTREFVSKARALKSQHNLAPKNDVAFFYTTDPLNHEFIQKNRAKLEKMIGANNGLEPCSAPPEDAPATITGLGTLYLDLSSAIDTAAEKERLTKELAKFGRIIQTAEGKLKNEKFIAKAPPEVVEGVRSQLTETKAKKEEVQRLLIKL